MQASPLPTTFEHTAVSRSLSSSAAAGVGDEEPCWAGIRSDYTGVRRAQTQPEHLLLQHPDLAWLQQEQRHPPFQDQEEFLQSLLEGDQEELKLGEGYAGQGYEGARGAACSLEGAGHLIAAFCTRCTAWVVHAWVGPVVLGLHPLALSRHTPCQCRPPFLSSKQSRDCIFAGMDISQQAAMIWSNVQAGGEHHGSRL